MVRKPKTPISLDPSDITISMEISVDKKHVAVHLNSDKTMDSNVAIEALMTFLAANGVNIDRNHGPVEPH